MEFHDHFNDLLLFPFQKYDVYSNSMKKFTTAFNIDDLNNRKETSKKSVCGLSPKEHNVVYYPMLQLGQQLCYKLKSIEF